MKLGDILKKVGLSAVKTLVPGGEFLIDTVNSFLPNDKKLPVEATGQQVEQAIQTLSPEQQVQLMSREYDVQIAEINAWAQVQGYLAEADKSGASTRPKISMMMAKVTCFSIVTFTVALSIPLFRIIVYGDPVEALKVVGNVWIAMAAILGIPSALLRAYFAMRKEEKEDRYHLAIGQPPKVGLLEGIVNLIKR